MILSAEFERTYLLQVVDRLWMDHIDALDIMRAGIGFRSVAQRDPLVEFKNEAFRMFDDLKLAIQHYTVDSLLRMLRSDITITLQRPEPQQKALANVHTNADDMAKAIGEAKSDEPEVQQRKPAQTRKGGSRSQSQNVRSQSANARNSANQSSSVGVANTLTKVGRNDLCPCGSGKKYKKCHGA